MEKQLIFRSVAQNVPFFVVTAGSVENGQFVRGDGDLVQIMNLPGVYREAVRYDEDLFGAEPFISRKSFNVFLSHYYHCGHAVGAEFYDGFIVLKFDVDESKEKTSEKE